MAQAFGPLQRKESTMTVAPARPGYSILIPADTFARAGDYLVSLRSRSHEPGAELAARLQGRRPESLDVDDLLGELIDTKQGQIFAESAVAGDGSDWNLTELGLLGDMSVAVPCTIFDDGHHTRPKLHTPPFQGTLVYTPGALLRNGRGHTPADWHAVVGHDGQIDDAGYDALYRRRLLPVFEYVNAHAPGPRSALLTIPGIGCGQFAGVFAGTLGIRLERALVRFLQEHGPSFPNLKAVYFDPYRECENSRHDIHGIAFLVRPFTKHPRGGRSQLCRPAEFAEAGDDFAGCDLFSIVAWDHVSCPGNDFFAGDRATDDGVKAAATSSMEVLTGVTGTYDTRSQRYTPPKPYRTWNDVLDHGRATRGLRLWKPAAVWPGRS